MTDAHESFEVRQASDHVERRPVVYIVLASLLVSAGALVAVRALLSSGTAPPAQTAPVPAGTLESSLVTRTARGLDLRRAQRRDLDTWRMVDRDAGVANIPIGTAIDVLLGNPIPASRPFDPQDAGRAPEEPPP